MNENHEIRIAWKNGKPLVVLVYRGSAVCRWENVVSIEQGVTLALRKMAEMEAQR